MSHRQIDWFLFECLVRLCFFVSSAFNSICQNKKAKEIRFEEYKNRKKNKRNCFSSYFSWFVPICTRFVHCCCVCVCERARALLLCFLSHIIDLKSKKEKERERAKSMVLIVFRFIFYYFNHLIYFSDVHYATATISFKSFCICVIAWAMQHNWKLFSKNDKKTKNAITMVKCKKNNTWTDNHRQSSEKERRKQLYKDASYIYSTQSHKSTQSTCQLQKFHRNDFFPHSFA